MNQERVFAASQSDAQSGASGEANPSSAGNQASDEEQAASIAAAFPSPSASPGTVRLSPPQPIASAPSPQAGELGEREGSLGIGTSAPMASAGYQTLFAMPGQAQFAASDVTALQSETGPTLPFLEDGTGRRFALRPGVNTIGRDHTDIQIADRSISRYHGMIVYDEERDICSVEDAGSLNGSRVNGERLLSHRPRAIKPGDTITFGDIILHFADAANAAAHPHAEEAYIASPEELAELAQEIEAAPTNLLEHFLWLKLLRGDAPQEILVGQGITTIGRLPDNIVCLNDDRYVSGHHAKIEASGEVFLLLDVGSTNGTYLNGLRLTTNTAVAMSDNDEVLLGGLLFQVCKPTLDAFAPEESFDSDPKAGSLSPLQNQAE